MFDLYQNVLFTCILSTTLPGSNGNEDNDINLILLSQPQMGCSQNLITLLFIYLYVSLSPPQSITL